jgi:hypothetical protein
LFAGISNSNPFATYYVNPLAVGLPGGTGRLAFGTPLYTVTTNPTLTGAFSTGTGLSGSASAALPSTASGAPAVHYTFVSPLPRSPATTEIRRQDLEQVLARSSGLSSKENIRVTVQGEVVVLRGAVADDHERRLAESLIRLSPGVHDIRNELAVRGASSRPPGQ